MSIRVAVVQAASVFMDRASSTEKAVQLIAEAKKGGAELILFPEAFIPAYPRGLSFGAPVGSRSAAGRELWQRYFDNAVAIPSETVDILSQAVRDSAAYVALPVIERAPASAKTLYCSILYFGPDGSLLGVHRKLKPTAAERIIWGEGDGSTLSVFDTALGKVGGLICWENYMPLARMALYFKGVEIYLAPTADGRDTWQATLTHIACEGRCFVLGCNQFATRSMYPKDLPGIEDLRGAPEILCRGGSAIISPFGDYLAGPFYDQEGILYADLDMTLIAKGKFDFDVTGHYARPDVFRLIVDEQSKAPVELWREDNK